MANEMWAWIFNNPKIGAYQNLRRLLKNDFDYESTFYKVLEGGEFTEDEREAVTEAVFYAYKQLDDKTRKYNIADQLVDVSDVCKFIEKFSGMPANTGRNDTKGFFFSLNQDLFVERYFSSSDCKSIHPFVHQPMLSQDTVFDKDAHSVTLPSAATIEKNNPLSAGKFFYVKLHGSWNWYSSDGKKKMIIGRNKLNQMNSEPVLMRYFEMFKNVLSRGEISLLTIGYGFGDEHINQVIAEAIAQNSLKLYVLNPTDPAVFKTGICSKPFGQEIFNGLIGYYPFDLSTVFPMNGACTNEYELICQQIFVN